MGNLVRKPAQILINAVDKTSGQETITGGSGAIVLKDYGTILAANCEHKGVAAHLLKAVTNIGTVQSVLLDLNPDITDSGDLPLSTSIFVQKKPRLAGQVGATNDIRMSGKDYGYHLDTLADAISSGKLGANDLATLGDGIINTAQGDRYPFVGIGKGAVYDISDDTVALALTINGTTYSETGIAAFLAAINAGSYVNAWYIAGTSPAGTLYLTPKANFDLICSAPTGMAASSSYHYLIGISSLDVNYQFIVGFDDDKGSTVSENKGVYPYMRDVEVSRIFPILSGMVGSNPKRPVMGVTYALYKFKAISDAYSLSGFNHADKYIEKVQVFVADVGTNIADFDAALTAGSFTTDS